MRPPLTVRPAIATDANDAASILARAFDADLPLNWLVRKDARRPAAIHEFFLASFRTMTFPFGACELASDGSGVALWTPPGKWKAGALRQLGLLPSFARVLSWPRLPKMVQCMNRVLRAHPHAPHYYLFSMGVDPAAQGRGVGSALLRSRLDRCDAERAPAYLEASSPMSRRLYERHGFAVTGDEILMAPDAPPLWPMWRDPR